MTVAVSSGLLDLSAAKFGMDALGMPDERITIRVIVASMDGSKEARLYGTYVIGGRHAQISSQRLADFGPEVNVLSIERFSIHDIVEEFGRLVSRTRFDAKVELRWDKGKAWLAVNGKLLPVEVEEVYVAAAKVWAILVCQGKRLRIAVGDELEMFDMSRRRLSGMRMKGEKLMLERDFQNPRS